MKKTTRRAAIAGAAVLAVVGGAVWKLHPLRKSYPPTPYDDLLSQIVDREPAARLGAAVAKSQPGLEASALAQQLRAGPRLSARARADAAQNRLIEAGGWVLPQSVALYAALAAKFA